MTAEEQLRFSLVQSCAVELESDGSIATRISDEFDNAILFTNRLLSPGEAFQVNIEKSTEKFSGALEIGISSEKFVSSDDPKSLKNINRVILRDTDVLSQSFDLASPVCNDYCPISLDNMGKGDSVGVAISEEKYLHFLVNGVDLGPVRELGILESSYFGFVKLYGKTTQISICKTSMLSEISFGDDADAEEDYQKTSDSMPDFKRKYPSSLFVGSKLGHNLQPLFDGISVVRRERRDINENYMLSSLPLIIGHSYEFRIDQVDHSSNGSLSLGIVPCKEQQDNFHADNACILVGPFGVFTGSTAYEPSSVGFHIFFKAFNSLKIGDIVKCSCKSSSFNISINDDAEWAFDSRKFDLESSKLYFDLSYNVVQLSYLDNRSEAWGGGSIDDNPELMKPLAFHEKHGMNCGVDKNRLTGARIHPESEFSDSILFSNRPLADGELFEVNIDSTLPMWSGSLEIGLTALDPDKVIASSLPKTMTQLTRDVWMISGSAVVHNGDTIWNNYNCDLDKLVTGSKVGVMREGDGTMHVYLDGQDQGIACVHVPAGVWAILDLYGQCHMATILHPNQGPMLSRTGKHKDPEAKAQTKSGYSVATLFNFHQSPVDVLNLMPSTKLMAENEQHKLKDKLFFSDKTLSHGDVFSVKLTVVESSSIKSSLKFGVTSFNPHGSEVKSIVKFTSLSKSSLVYIKDSDLFCNDTVLQEAYICPSLNHMSSKESSFILSVSILPSGFISFARDSNWLEPVAINPEITQAAQYVFIDLSRTNVSCVEVLTKQRSHKKVTRTRIPNFNLDLELMSPAGNKDSKTKSVRACKFEASSKGVVFTNDSSTAKRDSSVAVSYLLNSRILTSENSFAVRIDQVDARYQKDFGIGICEASIMGDELTTGYISTLYGNCKSSWWILISKHGVFQSGNLIDRQVCISDRWLQIGATIGLIKESDSLYLTVNGRREYFVSKLHNSRLVKPFVQLSGSVLQVSLAANDLIQKPGQDPEACVTHKEKAAFVDSIKEGLDQISCPYLNICKCFKDQLQLARGFFKGKKSANIGIHCYCEDCQKVRALNGTGETCFKQGEPSKPFTLPLGWCQFNLKRKSVGVTPDYSTWHVAYHCPKWSELKKILQAGHLLSTKSVEHILSPTLQYCSQDKLTAPAPFSHSCKIYLAKVALQVWVKPGSYASEVPSKDVDLVIDPDIPLTEHHWVSKDPQNVFVSSLLINVTPEI